MPRIITKLLAVICLLAAMPAARAFSLTGPVATWMRQELGYQIDGSDVLGPMNLGEEYRWNQKNITYAFDNSFLDYFGSNGVAAVEAAIKILNDLPSTANMSADLNEFPLDTRRVNYTAQSLNLVDVKSWTLSTLLEQVGVAPAERWVYTLRERVPIGPVPIYLYSVLRRNFDPVTLQPSSYVNACLYTYVIQQTYGNPDIFEAVEVAVDPNLPSVTSVAAFTDSLGTFDPLRGQLASQAFGTFFSGLTKDDIGALRYIYRSQNYNVETLGNVTLASGVGVTGGGSAGGGTGGGPFDSPFGSTGGGGDIWAPAISGTLTNAQGQGTGGAVTNFTRPVIDTAMRGGIEKLNFVRVNYDTTLGVVLPIRNRFADTYITNGVTLTQFVEVDTARPDIVFSANDLGVYGGSEVPVFFNRVINFITQDAINGVEGLPGPGNIRGPITLAFSDVGLYWRNVGTGSGEQEGQIGPVWGSFDGTTNAPVVFPIGTSIYDLERAILGR